MAQRTVTLASETDWPGFRQQARALLAALVAPEAVTWHTPASGAADLFCESDGAVVASHPAHGAMNLVVPSSFVTLCEAVILHNDPGRFGLLYRILWRLVHEPLLRHDPLDADRVDAQHMAQAVRRDMHKMKAFVRFRTIERGEAQSPLHVAWFEPDHYIVEAVAPFFTRRFTQMEWAILTPERSVHWDGEHLQFGPGGERRDAPPPDAGEALWLTYYAHIFNPARLKVAMMKKEMPVKYWRNLPEAELISGLTAGAMARSGRMVDAAPTTPARRISVRAASRVLPIASEVALSNPTPELPADPAEALGVLKQATNRCRECPIGEHATQSVFGEGPVRAALMVVGEQPGDQEDLRGRPFVGPAGQLFDQAIAQLGWPRDQLYVTNAVKHFKFELRGKRRIHKTPTQREAAACLHWLESEKQQVRPRALVALGATAARALLGRSVAVMKERGQWHEDAQGRKVLVTLHPSALLRGDPAEYAQAYQGWLDDLALASEWLTLAPTD
ncbi:UdgX family uracil-DNA binding protein [Variovorax sp. PAMC 28711]|uniref:UdgX family uracil-DNA binding protein n=1 Tax=Variovorax sp. PAMC 28711 TaxID=1795631 RepID=UPI00078C33A0|nr:UdgX family uracil-DNA binding protein [Variovorax sp. PAMC 28711]AMM24732.1 uracil-DNA glycosylase [Variovorax sp. PAMC 28711]